MKRLYFTLILILLPFVGSAKIELPAILSDNMVLQQQSQVKLWGWGDSEKKVIVTTTWSHARWETISDESGRWIVEIDTPQAGGPYQITVSDGSSVTLDNVLIGEVWLCSGQSNMEMPMKGFEFEFVEGANEVIASANESTPIRVFSTDCDGTRWVRQHSKSPLEDCQGQWWVNNSHNVAYSSATAYYFAKHLNRALGIPVGIVLSSWGGSKVEAWMSRECASEFNLNLEHLDSSENLPMPIQSQPCVLYNSKIAPLTNFKIKGFLWYQGESNRDNVEAYSKKLPAMVADYRKCWGYDFPFYYVEIAPYSYGNVKSQSAALFREMQQNLMDVIPNSGMVTTADIGLRDFIHPSQKSQVGERLAYWALAKNYDRKNVGYSTPKYESMEVKDGKALITFSNAAGKVHPINQPLKSFEIAGSDKIFYPAEAIVNLKTKQLEVWNNEISEPVAVRYAFYNYFEASLFDFYGLPVAPFRTDDW